MRLNHKKYALYLLYTFTFTGISFTQSHVDVFLLENIKNKLLKDNNVKEVKLEHGKHENGFTKYLSLKVKYHSDTTERYWEAGPSVHYYDNGQVKGYMNTNIKTHVRCDTSKLYYKDGSLKGIFIFPNHYIDSLHYSSLLTSEDIKSNFFVPDSYTHIHYLKQGTGSYSVTSNRIVLSPKKISRKHGICEKYNHKNGVLTLREYKMGKLVSSYDKRIE